VNALGFLSQHLVVLLDPASIVPNLHHAYRRRAEFDAPYGVLMTGPSATAGLFGYEMASSETNLNAQARIRPQRNTKGRTRATTVRRKALAALSAPSADPEIDASATTLSVAAATAVNRIAPKVADEC